MTNSTKLTWIFLSQFSFHNPPLINLSRSKEVEEKYLAHQKFLNQTGLTVNTYLNQLYFPLGKNDKPYRLEKNTYPYNVDDNIIHFLIWFNPHVESSNDILNHKKVIEIIRKLLFQEQGLLGEIDSQCIYFQNAEAFRSVKALPHIHIFLNRSALNSTSNL